MMTMEAYRKQLATYFCLECGLLMDRWFGACVECRGRNRQWFSNRHSLSLANLRRSIGKRQQSNPLLIRAAQWTTLVSIVGLYVLSKL